MATTKNDRQTKVLMKLRKPGLFWTLDIQQVLQVSVSPFISRAAEGKEEGSELQGRADVQNVTGTCPLSNKEIAIGLNLQSSQFADEA